MVEVRTDWLKETAERRWSQLEAEDLSKRKRNQKRRNWPRQLTIEEIRSIDRAKNLIGLDKQVWGGLFQHLNKSISTSIISKV
jgi:hypothetical protein